MKILISTLAFSNPELLDKCISSWPKNVDKCVLWQGFRHPEMEPIINKHRDNLSIYLRRKNNWYVSGGWNIILREAFLKNDFDGVVLVGSDTAFLSGFWEEFIYKIEKYDFVESSHQFNCFYVSRKCFDIVGTFDENIVNYCEDDDYRLRVKLSGINYLHSKGNKDLFLHEYSSTVRKNPIYALKSRKSFALNKQYMTEKWGGIEQSIPKWNPVYKTPFNDPNWPLDKWVLNPQGRIARLWDNIIEDKDDDRLIHLVNALKYPDKYIYDYKT